MSRMIDLDKILGIMQRIGPELPGAIETAMAAGVPIPAAAMQYAPLLSLAANMIDKMVPHSGVKAMTKAGVDTGPLSRGCSAYLRRRENWQDGEVVRAAEFVLSPEVGLEGAGSLIKLITSIEQVMYPDVSNLSISQQRQVIDRVLTIDALGDGITDLFGDHIHKVLRNKLAPMPGAQEIINATPVKE